MLDLEKQNARLRSELIAARTAILELASAQSLGIFGKLSQL